MKRILITGGSGFVGGHLLTMSRNEWEVFTIYHNRPVSISGVFSVAFNFENKNEIQPLVKKINPDVVIHCAVWGDVDECEKDRKRAFLINAEATGILAETCSEIESRFIYTSSDMVFDGKKGDYIESDPPCPLNIYGKSKFIGEERVKKACSNYVVARVALIYGRPVLGNNSFSEKILERIRQGKTMPLFIDQYRTPILVQNLAQVLLELAGLDFRGTIHLGGAKKVDRYTFGLRLAELKGLSQKMLRPVNMSEIPTTAPRPRDVSLDTSKAKSLLKTPLLGYWDGLKLA